MSVNVGILILRVLIGLAIAAHGAQKFFGWFGGPGLRGTSAFFETIGFRPPVTFAMFAGLAELGGGLLLALGLFTPLGSAAVLASMLVAMATIHKGNGFFATNNGIELPYLYATAAIGIAITGAGTVSFDNLFGLRFLSVPAVTIGLLVLGVIGAFIAVGMRRRPPAETKGGAAEQPSPPEKREAA